MYAVKRITSSDGVGTVDTGNKANKRWTLATNAKNTPFVSTGIDENDVIREFVDCFDTLSIAEPT